MWMCKVFADLQNRHQSKYSRALATTFESVVSEWVGDENIVISAESVP